MDLNQYIRDVVTLFLVLLHSYVTILKIMLQCY